MKLLIELGRGERTVGLWLRRSSAVIVFVAMWEVLPRTGLVSRYFLRPFSEVMVAIWRLALTGELWQHLAASGMRVGLGLAIAIALGIPLGFLLAASPLAFQILDPLVQGARQISAFALFPIFMLFFGIGEVSKAIIIVWGCLWPIVLNTMKGIQEIPPLLVQSVRTMGADRSFLFWKVVLPAAAPVVFTGVRLAAAYALMVLVAAEMLGANAGLGFEIMHSQETGKIENMYASIFLLSAAGIGLNALLQRLEIAMSPWRQTRVRAGL